MMMTNAASSRVRGFGDLTVGAGVQWAPKEIRGGVFAHRLKFEMDAPTGTYSDSRPVNIGNHFVVNPYYAFTYKRKKLEFSARLHYLRNSDNNDPFVRFGIRNVQAEQAFHVNYATSYEVLKKVRLGFSGYWLQQVTDHRIDGSSVPGSMERIVGLVSRSEAGPSGVHVCCISATARMPTFLSNTSRPRISSGLSSENTFFICPECFRKAETMRSLPCGVRATIRTRRSSALSARLTKPFATRRSTATLIEPGVRSTMGPIVLTGKGPLCSSSSSTPKSERPKPVSSIPAAAYLVRARIAFIITSQRWSVP
jgi:hypothetical protein